MREALYKSKTNYQSLHIKPFNLSKLELLKSMPLATKPKNISLECSDRAKASESVPAVTVRPKQPVPR